MDEEPCQEANAAWAGGGWAAVGSWFCSAFPLSSSPCLLFRVCREVAGVWLSLVLGMNQGVVGGRNYLQEGAREMGKGH